MSRKKPAQSGLDRERARRRKLDRAKANPLLVRSAERSGSPPRRGADDAAAATRDVPVSSGADLGSTSRGARLAGQRVGCVWCGSPVEVKARGPLPKFCSANCRHRAWEQERAARAGRAAVVAVDRTVVVYPNGTQEWIAHLKRLAAEVRGGQLEDIRLTAALDLVYDAVAHRQLRGRVTDPW